MQQINLKSESAISQAKFKQAVGGAGSIVFSLILIGIGAASYMGLYYYNTKTKSQTQNYITQKDERLKKLSGKDYQELYFFQDRLIDLSYRLDRRVNHDVVLQKLSNATLPEIIYSNIKFDIFNGRSKVDVSLMASDYETVNRQLKAYTLIDGISEYAPNGISKDKNSSNYSANIKFTLTEKPTTTDSQTKVAP